jgi:hypothetical protein
MMEMKNGYISNRSEHTWETTLDRKQTYLQHHRPRAKHQSSPKRGRIRISNIPETNEPSPLYYRWIHTPGSTLLSTIIGNLQLYLRENAREEDFVSITTEFVVHLTNRGNEIATTIAILHEAFANID